MLETVHEADEDGADTDYDEDNEELTPEHGTGSPVSTCNGAGFKPFDVALALDERLLPPEPDPFAPLPVCSPGMLMQANGLPAEPGDVSGNYPYVSPGPASWSMTTGIPTTSSAASVRLSKSSGPAQPPRSNRKPATSWA